MRFSFPLGMLADVGRPLLRLIAAWLPLALAAGCSKPVSPVPDTASPAATVTTDASSRQAQAAHRAKAQEAAREIDQIPPPAKSRYLAIHTQESWGNPFLIVGRESIRMQVILPDVNPSAYGTGTMLRPADARRQQLDVRLADLPDALAAVPVAAWPYGRVVAVEEIPLTNKADRPQVRRNVEATIQMLNDLGIVVDEWTGPNGSLLR